MNQNSDIWTVAVGHTEDFVQRMSESTYGFFFHGLCIFGLALLLCGLTSRGQATSRALNWCWLLIALVLGAKAPILVPESVTAKVLLLLAGAAVLSLAPARLCVYLSGNEKQRRRVQLGLYTLIMVVFAIDQLIRKAS